MTPFQVVLAVAGAVTVVSLLAGLALILRSRDVSTRVVVADLIFYAMLVAYLLWTLANPTSITYDVVLLAAIAGGVLPTLSMARMISRGRR